MTDHVNEEDEDSPGPSRPEEATDGVETIETYDTDNGVVFYDSENPLAWLQASMTVRLGEYT